MSSKLELLQQIVANTGRSDSISVALISGGSALLGAAIGAGISYLGLRISRDLEIKKLKASLVATERLRWMRELRERFSAFFTRLDMQYSLIKRPVQRDQAAAFQRTLDEYSSTISEQSHMITVMLDPGIPEQMELRRAINDALSFFLECVARKEFDAMSFDDGAYTSIKDRGLIAISKIGSETWGRVKELE